MSKSQYKRISEQWPEMAKVIRDGVIREAVAAVNRVDANTPMQKWGGGVDPDEVIREIRKIKGRK